MICEENVPLFWECGNCGRSGQLPTLVQETGVIGERFISTTCGCGALLADEIEVEDTLTTLEGKP